MKISERDLEALRSGIREQERADIIREETRRTMERTMARKSVRNPRLRPAWNVGEGSIIASCDGGNFFYAWARVLDATRKDDGNIWLNYELFAGGTGGSTFRPSDVILLGDLPGAGI